MYPITFTDSEVMALRDLLVEYMRQPTRTLEFIDCTRNVTTTPEQLLLRLMAPRWSPDDLDTGGPMDEPDTPEAWQMAVDLARAGLLLDAARGLRLVRGGPLVDVGRCEALLATGATRGIHPTEEGVDMALVVLAVEFAPSAPADGGEKAMGG
jgi:hypothetical protein